MKIKFKIFLQKDQKDYLINFISFTIFRNDY